ncbi:OsmC family peroxiredoxin [Euzebya sp.]|uniref:OsmC family peroxiredoxin n=1 Tax=Euzebya sp. TaxID=1971409 RepID=UPI0035132322
MAATATARWEGSLDDGTGQMSTGTGLEAPFTKASRFADGEGSNPEELIGAAHAGCFSMFLSALLSKDGHPPTSIETTARVSMDMSGAAPRISRIDLKTTGEVPGIDADTFQAKAEEAKEGCPVSAALASVPTITLEATLA